MMKAKSTPSKRHDVAYTPLDLAGVRYAILPEAVLLALMKRAGIEPASGEPSAATDPRPLDDLAAGDAGRFARRLIARREAARLSQADLARQAGVRIETLNRIERGHTMPGLTTIRKLVVALKQAEAANARASLPSPRQRSHS